MGSDLDQMKQEMLGRIAAAADLPALEAERVAALGKQGAVTGLLKSLGAHDARGAAERGAAHPRPARGGHRGDRGAQGGAGGGRARAPARHRDGST